MMIGISHRVYADNIHPGFQPDAQIIHPSYIQEATAIKLKTVGK